MTIKSTIGETRYGTGVKGERKSKGPRRKEDGNVCRHGQGTERSKLTGTLCDPCGTTIL